MAVRGLKVGSLNTSDDVSGLVKIVPTSVAVGSGSGSASALGIVTFSGASSVSLNGVFSSTYKNYRINFDNIIMPVGAGGTDMLLRLRANGTNTTTNYTGAGFYMSHNSATVTGATVSSIFIKLILHNLMDLV